MTGTRLIRAKWLVPSSGPPVKNATLKISNNLISEIDSNHLNDKSDSEQNNTIILPGFINLHSHLDYSKLPFNACPLFSWIENLVSTTRDWSTDQFLESARYGAGQALLQGTTFLVDSSYSGAGARAMAEIGLKGIVGLELFGVDQNKSEMLFSHWQKRFEPLAEAMPGNIKLTISPHSLYTVSPALFQKACQWAREQSLPVLTHLSESLEEFEWTQKGNKRIDNYLQVVIPVGDEKEKREVVESISWKSKGLSPVKSLEEAGCLTDALVAAHAVRLTEEDRNVLKQHGVKLAHCPRSNKNLENGRAELEKILLEKISVGLGTDSLASTENLSMLEEARSMLDVHGDSLDVALNESDAKTREELALRLITIESARLLGIDSETGSLEKGKRADLVVMEMESNLDSLGPDQIYSSLFSSLSSGKARIKSVFIDGIQRVEEGSLCPVPGQN